MTCERYALWVMTMNRMAFWVLHTRPYGDSSVVAELLTAEQGRIGVLVRSGRRQSGLQPFMPMTGILAGRGELQTLRQGETSGCPLLLAGRRLYCGLYLNELLVRLLHRHVPCPDIMPAYERALLHLADIHHAEGVVLREFELTLLEVMGYGLDFDECSSGNRLSATMNYRFDPGMGLVSSSVGWPGNILQMIGRRQWNEQTRAAARELMRQALAPWLGGRPLHSRAFFRTSRSGEQKA